nr:prefoldin subunit 4 [Ciona intestinalis]|eukprot:XP_026694824.1 prefoldin subunit 4 [Ciona intestinalis]
MSSDKEEVQVTLEDQKKINLFAKKNGNLNEIETELEEIKKALQNIEDAGDDLLLLEDEDSEAIPYQLGEVFIQHNLEETQGLLEKEKDKYEQRMKQLKEEAGEIESMMKELKVQLYAKFGDNINLEA